MRKVSRYTLILSHFPRHGAHLLFNTRTQAKVVIDDELKNALESLPDKEPEGKPAEAMETLEKLGFVVENSVDEDGIIAEWFGKIGADRSVLKPTVLTTYACNFACVYCVEEGVRDPVFMSEDTAQKTIAYIGEKARVLGTPKISLTFYGGEPLLNLPAVRTVAGGVGKLARESGIDFSFGMITNGSLLTRDLVNELKPLGMTWAKVTLDGIREIHDKKRPFASGEGSFDVILRNVRDALDSIHIDIGGNFDRETVEDIPHLLDYLAGFGLQNKIRRIVFKPICRTPKERESLAPSVELSCAFGGMENIHKTVDLRKTAREKGFSVDEGIGIHLCDAVMSPCTFTVDPRGILYRCPAFVGRNELSCGTIDAGEREDAMPELWKRCAGCVYVPLCGNGCIYDAYIRFGDPKRLSCNREAMEYIVRESLKDGYVRSHKR